MASKKAEMIWNMMTAKAGTVFIQSRPGMSKSATIEALAKEHGYAYIDLRLSTMDETDVGGMPCKVEKEVNGRKVTVSTVAYPEFAVATWDRPTVICLEELNRATLYVRNAALGLLNERRIGNFEIAPETLLIATGNLGEGDDCEVEDFDAALRGRLIHVKWDMNFTEWCEGYANANVEPELVDFIRDNPTNYYKTSKDGAYASPRTWTFLSKYMKVLKDNGIDGQSMIGELRKSGASYVGPSAVEFVAYLESRFSLSIDDIINGTKFKTLERSQQLRLIGDLKSKYPDFKFDDKKSYDNVEKLLKVCDEDFISEWILATLKVATFTEAQNPMGYAFMKREWVREIGKKAVAKNK